MATRRAAAKERGKPAKSARPRTAPRPATPRRAADDVVREKTGRTRAQWFAILDVFDCRAHGHKAAAAHLMECHGVSPWWAQALTVEYERERAIRSCAEREDGYEFTVQRALAATAERVWRAITDPREVSAWRTSRHQQQFRLGGRWRNADGSRGAFARAVQGRYVRFSWEDPRRAPGSVVEMEIRLRGEDRATLKVTHRRIRSEEEREDLRSHWSWALDSLKSWVETGAPIPHDAWVQSRL